MNVQKIWTPLLFSFAFFMKTGNNQLDVGFHYFQKIKNCSWPTNNCWNMGMLTIVGALVPLPYLPFVSRSVAGALPALDNGRVKSFERMRSIDTYGRRVVGVKIASKTRRILCNSFGYATTCIQTERRTALSRLTTSSPVSLNFSLGRLRLSHFRCDDGRGEWSSRSSTTMSWSRHLTSLIIIIIIVMITIVIIIIIIIIYI